MSRVDVALEDIEANYAAALLGMTDALDVETLTLSVGDAYESRDAHPAGLVTHHLEIGSLGVIVDGSDDGGPIDDHGCDATDLLDVICDALGESDHFGLWCALRYGTARQVAA